jgi:Flp pilus assembly protein TadG
MRKLSLLMLLLPFFLVSNAFAESRATVNIKNNVNSDSSSTVNSTTKIRVDVNGKVTEYSSDKPENIEVKAVNDTSEIKVNGQVVTGSPSSTSNVTPSEKPTEEPTPTKAQTDENEDKENEEEQRENLLDAINDFIDKIVSIFR